MARALRIIAWTISLIGPLYSGPIAKGQDVPAVDGDPKLLLMIRDAQHANADRYPYGEMEVVAAMGAIGKQVPDRRIEALVRWDKERVRLRGAFTDSTENKGGGEPKLLKQTFELIYRNNRSVMYVPGQRLMTISDVSRSGHILLTRLRPQDWWYGKINGDDPSWAELYDGMIRLPPELLRRVRVRRLDSDQIEIACSKGMPDTFREVFSLRDEGNMLLYEGADPEHGLEEKRTYSWARDAREHCSLKSLRVERRIRTPEVKSESYYTYEVVRFDPDKRPPQSIFEDRSIQVSPGTIVDDRTTGKRRRVGDPPAEDVGVTLDRLVPVVKSRGFANPAREQ